MKSSVPSISATSGARMLRRGLGRDYAVISLNPGLLTLGSSLSGCFSRPQSIMEPAKEKS